MRPENPPVGIGDLSSGALFTALVVSCVGMGIFLYGKRERRWPQLAAGVVLMVFPYAVPNALPMIGIAVGVIVVLWFLVRAGY